MQKAAFAALGLRFLRHISGPPSLKGKRGGFKEERK